MRFSVVVPAYREAERIGATVDSLRAALAPVSARGGAEIVVVDDGSDDGTAAAAREAGADEVVELPHNRGKGAAVRAGMRASSGSVVAFTDADLAYPPHQLVGLLDKVEEGADIVIGDRRHPDSVAVAKPRALRWAGSHIVVSTLRWALRLGGDYDTQCGLKAFRRAAALELLEASVIDRFAFDIELLYVAERWGLSVREVPVELVNSDTSSVSIVGDGLKLARDMGRIRVRAVLGRYPARPSVRAPGDRDDAGPE